MYEEFGSIVDVVSKKVTFKLFHPDNNKAPAQYEGGGLPRILELFVEGPFSTPQKMERKAYLKNGEPIGAVYSYTSEPFSEGFYEYQYHVYFENGEDRYIYDPCSRYGGIKTTHSAFVVGGEDEKVEPIRERIPYKEQIVYELMTDDFTKDLIDANCSAFEAIISKLNYIKSLGITTIEFMPWFSWIYPEDPAKDFSWGYNPAQYFSVCHKYTNNSSKVANKLVYLKRLINECHLRNIHVIMDGVFNHADVQPPDRGFPYYWLYQDPADCPYVGDFAEADYFKDLDYANRCTLEYIRDACLYWIQEFKIDGIRFDYTKGMYKPGDRGHGIGKLLSELRMYLQDHSLDNFALILEHEWDYRSIDITNKLGATSCWFDKYRSLSFDFLGNRIHNHPQIEASIMRMLNAAKDFDTWRTPTLYLENHDHKRFMLKAGGRQYWYMTQPYVIALFTTSGAPLIYNGQEFGLDNDMPEFGEGRVVSRPILWELQTDTIGTALISFYKKMIRLRKDHPGLCSANFFPSDWDENSTTPTSDGFGINRQKNIVVYHRWGLDHIGRLEKFYVVINFNDSGNAMAVSFNVPDSGPWEDLLTGTKVYATKDDGISKLNVNVPPNWGAIYYQLGSINKLLFQ